MRTLRKDEQVQFEGTNRLLLTARGQTLKIETTGDEQTGNSFVIAYDLNQIEALEIFGFQNKEAQLRVVFTTEKRAFGMFPTHKLRYLLNQLTQGVDEFVPEA